MFCISCGTKLEDDARFCNVCGRSIAAAGVSAPAGEAFYAPPRRLRRIPSQKKIAGVCAGFAEYFDTDITLMRLIWLVLLLVPPGIGLVAYIAAWIVLPRDE